MSHLIVIARTNGTTTTLSVFLDEADAIEFLTNRKSSDE